MGLQPANLGNDDLRPERSTEYEVGAEFGLFDDRAAVDVTYWKRVTKDALIARLIVKFSRPNRLANAAGTL